MLPVCTDTGTVLGGGGSPGSLRSVGVTGSRPSASAPSRGDHWSQGSGVALRKGGRSRVLTVAGGGGGADRRVTA